MGKRGAGLCNGNGVDVRSYNVGSQADCFVKGRTAAHHRVKHNFVLKPARGVVITAFYAGELFENRPKSRAAPSRPPLVQVGIRTKQVLVEHFLPGECVDKFLGKGVIVLKPMLVTRGKINPSIGN